MGSIDSISFFTLTQKILISSTSIFKFRKTGRAAALPASQIATRRSATAKAI